MRDFLLQRREPVPQWLADFDPDRGFDSQAFFVSRIVYYPGSGTDGQPVQLFASTHSAHAFIYADYGVTEERIRSELHDARRGFRGYSILAIVQVSEAQLTPAGWQPHLGPMDAQRAQVRALRFAGADPYAMVVVLQRNADLGDEHGPRRLAILFIGGDGVATYDALFCQARGRPPFALVLQDHGFGGNYTRFGQRGLLQAVAQRADRYPEYLLCAHRNTEPWIGYAQIPDIADVVGGMWGNARGLFVREVHPQASHATGQ